VFRGFPRAELTLAKPDKPADGADGIRRQRERIDRIDDEILDLLNRRADCFEEIGKLKAASGGSVFVPSRELEIFERLEKRNSGPFPTSAIRNVFREVISASISVQRGVAVAYLGPQATYTHQAAIQQFGQMAEFVPADTTDQIFAAVEEGDAEYGVVPVENSNEGVESHTLDLFVDSPLTIGAEIHVAVHHDLLTRVSELRDVQSVCSHPQALAQCRRWLELNLPSVPQVPMSSTAAGAERAAREPGVAAIASPIAASIYGLNALRSGIEDRAENTTRFLVLTRTPPQPSARDITSLLFSIKRDQVGALYRALEPFAQHGVNLTRIESRPTKARAWEYVFFADFEGHVEDASVREAIAELEPRCDFVKVLGSYPRAEVR
jgi:chorismate mutase/prephenate dehydratase